VWIAFFVCKAGGVETGGERWLGETAGTVLAGKGRFLFGIGKSRVEGRVVHH